MKDGVEVYLTDFGMVRLSPGTLRYLDGITPDWRRMVDKPATRVRDRRPGKMQQRAAVHALFHALRTCAKRAFVLGENFKVF